MYFVGLDVSVKRTAVCVVDSAGRVVREALVETDPVTIVSTIRIFGEPIERVGLEAGVSSAWLARGLREAGLPAIVIDATHAAAALRTGFRNKTDRNDARGIADLMRVNKFRTVWVKSPESQRRRSLITVREQLRAQILEAKNTIWSLLQAEGLKPPKIVSPSFDALTREMMAADAGLQLLLKPLVTATEVLEELLVGVNRAITATAKRCSICQRLMSVPGVGPLVAFTFISGVDDPARFNRSRTVGAHFGLTPRRYQSGETDWAGRISRAGDAAVRRALYQAANVLIHRCGRWCALKSWAVRLAKRRGLGKAKVALARRLAVVLHKMWLTGEPYRWQVSIPA